MDGIFFYWFGWIGWVVSTFFWKKDRFRLYTSFFILLSLFFSNKTIELLQMNVNVSYLVLWMTAYLLIAAFKERFSVLYALVTTVILTGAYNAFRFLEFIDPVWIIFNEKVMLSVFLVWIVLILSKTFLHRTILLLSGVIHGEMVYMLSVEKFAFVEQIGSFYFFDITAISLVIISMWSMLENINVIFDSGWHKNLKQRQG